MKNIPIAAILALVALLLALVAILEVVKPWTALGLAVICLALAVLVPAASGVGGRERDRI